MRDKRFLFAVALALAVAMPWAAALPAETAGDLRARAVAVLRSNASLEQKLAACEDLARVGTKECVPVLAGMLGDEKLSHMARYALEPIPDKSVDEALRAAAAKLNGKLLSGVISSIGARRDSAAVELLGKYLGSSDGDVVRTTAIALGRIGTVAAGKALLTALPGTKKDNRIKICDGLLTCAASLAAQGRQDEAKRIHDGMLALNLPVRIRAAALSRCGALRSLRRHEATRPHDPRQRLLRVRHGIACCRGSKRPESHRGPGIGNRQTAGRPGGCRGQGPWPMRRQGSRPPVTHHDEKQGEGRGASRQSRRWPRSAIRRPCRSLWS